MFFARCDWLISLRISRTFKIHWFSSSSSKQATRNSRKLLEQNGFPRFAAVTLRNITNKEISEIIIKLFPKYTKKVMKFGLEVLTGKALSVWLEFSDETGNKVFCSQMQLSYALLYLADMFTNKLKTRFNSNF